MNLMTREEMLKLLGEGKSALEVSYEKWKRIATEEGIDFLLSMTYSNSEVYFKNGTCALCEVNDNECENCYLGEQVDNGDIEPEFNCSGNWYEFNESIIEKHIDVALYYAEKLVEEILYNMKIENKKKGGKHEKPRRIKKT